MRVREYSCALLPSTLASNPSLQAFGVNCGRPCQGAGSSGITRNETPLQRPEEPDVCGFGTTVVVRETCGL